MNWISKQNAQRKANLLKYNPVVDHASKGPEQRGKKLQKKILNLSEKHKGLHDAVIEGHGQNKYTTGDYDVDRQKLYKVDEKLENKLSKWKKRFGEDFSQWDNSPSMEGPLDKGCAKSEGGPGCVQKRGNEYVIINNKKPGNQVWRGGFASKAEANKVLSGYHANK